MKTEIIKSILKREYVTPNIDCIQLDNNISLQLESDPAIGPFETMSAPEFF